MSLDPLLLVYGVPLALIWVGWGVIGHRRSRAHRAILEDNRRAGLHEPPSLHPVIDPARCLGCGSCARACPEKTVLGLIDGKAELIEPTLCVGHGACRTACPTDAITLVFGTATRGVDIPLLSPEFESNVPGLAIAGELGGMGLIKNAIEQGRQAIAAIAERLRREGKPGGAMLDLIIVGCGPAGIAASLGAMERGLRFVTLDQASLGGSVAHFPRGKVVMTAPAHLPLIGEVRFGEISKERLLAFWQDVLRRTSIAPRFEEQVLAVNRLDDGFEVITDKDRLRARAVLLAIGRRGSARPLGVPGEDRDNVVYHLTDPGQYAGQRVLVVGGGDSALEAAISLAAEPETRVTLAYRGEGFTRARAKNRAKLQEMVDCGGVDLLLNSQVLRIGNGQVELDCAGQLFVLPNDDVIICAGGLLPGKFLADAGVLVETKFGTR